MSVWAAKPKQAPARDRSMSLAAHLIELRKRFGRAAGAIILGAIAGWFLADFVMNAIREPVIAAAKQQGHVAVLNFDSVTGAFDLKIQIAGVVGLLISSPIWLYQIWAFFVPALTRKELKYAFGFFFSAVPLFLAGCAAGWYVIPRIVLLLQSFVPGQDASILKATDYFSFVLKLTVVVGIAFVLPVFVVLLNFVGVLSARSIVRSWRVALIAITLFSALATPSVDIVSMFVLAVPMAGLFLAAAGIAVLHDRRAAKVAAALEAQYSKELH
jgi:sec-independent protein translocase protein TatC